MRMRFWIAFLLCAALAGSCGAAVDLHVAGKVVDLDGRPVGSVKVFAVASYEDAPTVLTSAPAGSDGRFDLGRIRLKADPKTDDSPELVLIAYEPDAWMGWVSCYVTELLADREASALAKLVVHVDVPGTFEGLVTDDSGNPIAGAKVECETATIGNRGEIWCFEFASGDDLAQVIPMAAATTGADGRYKLTNVPANADVDVKVTKSGLAMKSWGFMIESRTDMVMIPAGGISGRVVDRDGKGIAGASISANADWSGDIRGAQGEANTRQDGSFVIKDLPPDKYDVGVCLPHNGSLIYQREGVRVKANGVTRMSDIVSEPPTHLAGRVLDNETGKPIAGVDVSASSSGFYSDPVTSDRLGRFRVAVLPGEVTISCYGDDDTYGYTPPDKGKHVKVRIIRPRRLRYQAQEQRPVQGAGRRPHGQGTGGHYGFHPCGRHIRRGHGRRRQVHPRSPACIDAVGRWVRAQHLRERHGRAAGNEQRR